MEIPLVLGKKVKRTFGAQGETWLQKLPHLVAECIEEWQLATCHNSPVMSHNYICFANSPDYGHVALKVGVPHNELTTEMTALQLYQGRYICRCHAFDRELGALLLERIMPGHDLTTVHNSSGRIRIAAELVSTLPVSVTHRQGLPLLSELAERTFSRLKAEHPTQAQMIALAGICQGKIEELEAPGRPLVLLHGDLNHWNILLDQDGSWKAIDPKGQIGAAGMEGARFMINELAMVDEAHQMACLEEMTTVFGAKFGQPRATIALYAFIDKTLSTSWKFEEHTQKDRSTDVKMCAKLWDYHQSLML